MIMLNKKFSLSLLLSLSLSRYLSLSGRAESSLVGRFYVLIYMLVMRLLIMFSVR